MCDSVGILSLNVRGLGNNDRRREIFHMLNRKTHQVIVLQETHSTVESAPFWKAEWGHSIIYSHGDSRSRGVAILLKIVYHMKFTQLKQTVKVDMLY